MELNLQEDNEDVGAIEKRTEVQNGFAIVQVGFVVDRCVDIFARSHGEARRRSSTCSGSARSLRTAATTVSTRSTSFFRAYRRT
eukprot:6436935-Prorocentrum_lima.AAC.1